MKARSWRGSYPRDWPELARVVKDAAGWRCVRCRHPFASRFHLYREGLSLPCDAQCDSSRGRHNGLANYGVHHLDGDKGNSRWWNLIAACNSCHLTLESRVIPERAWLFEHSEWFVPYVAGFYASYYGGAEITRAEAERDSAKYLALGQPWREGAA